MHIQKITKTVWEYDHREIEEALRELGATQSEAEALTDILDIEGWGGMEHEMPEGVTGRDFTPDELASKLEWYRDCRA